METSTWKCPTCGRDVARRLAQCPRCGSDPEGTQVDLGSPQERRQARRLATRDNRERNYKMVDALAQIGGKYQRALSGERFAAFSVIGTEDWEDYASLVFSGIQTEVLTDMDARLERLTAAVEKIALRLDDLIRVLDPSSGSESSSDFQA